MAAPQSDDTDLIARIYPADGDGGRALDAIRDSLNRSRFRDSDSAGEPPCLELRFSHGPRSSMGFTFGTATDSDVYLPPFNGISSRHCLMRFEKNESEDDHYIPVLRDVSTYGTTILYDDLTDRAINARWCLAEDPLAVESRNIFIEPVPRIRFRIVVSRHDFTSPIIIAKVERFRQGTTSAEDSLVGLRLRPTPVTQQPGGLPRIPVLASESKSESQPKPKPKLTIYRLCGELAEGSSGFVRRLENVHTGEYYAAKEIILDQETLKAERRKFKGEMEAAVQLQHERIVHFAAWREPKPGMIICAMELFEHQSLHNVAEKYVTEERQFTLREVGQVLKQVSEALVFLHGREAAHGNLKATNILIRALNPLSVAISDMINGKDKRRVQTLHYIAPEIADRVVATSETDKKPADIWALGAIAAQLLLQSNMPEMDESDPSTYPLRLKDVVQEMFDNSHEDREDKLRIICAMLALDPRDRPDAKECLENAEELLATVTAEDDGSQGPSAPSTTSSATPGGQQQDCQGSRKRRREEEEESEDELTKAAKALLREGDARFFALLEREQRRENEVEAARERKRARRNNK
ncbi:kinase-like domain-containing protein [Chaetomidium leptoderma]|uniref:non-specific serine/threonine protein kinase n=1 Tax=Chaetomidium leptoderma TaxID=669021 RepID=A0AAN6VKN0_9PEZI|nr:kinase-like domain-containing protein [Chaetomidium leptoderma]